MIDDKELKVLKDERFRIKKERLDVDMEKFNFIIFLMFFSAFVIFLIAYYQTRGGLGELQK